MRMKMTTKQAQKIWNMSDDELANELSVYFDSPDNDMVYKLYLNSIALSRILRKPYNPGGDNGMV